METMLARSAARSLWGLLTVLFTKPLDISAEYLSNKERIPRLAPNPEDLSPLDAISSECST